MKTELKFYYARDELNRPIVTICLLQIGEQISRGIAICSELDNPCKCTGRNIAEGRALQAILSGKTSNKIRRECSQRTIRNATFIPIHKAVFMPILTNHERKLLRIGVQNETDKYQQSKIPGLTIDIKNMSDYIKRKFIEY